MLNPTLEVSYHRAMLKQGLTRSPARTNRLPPFWCIDLKNNQMWCPEFIEVPPNEYVLGLPMSGRWFRNRDVRLSGCFLITWYLVVDIWSVGCIMAEMVLHKVLFPGRDCILHRERPRTRPWRLGWGWGCGPKNFMFISTFYVWFFVCCFF